MTAKDLNKFHTWTADEIKHYVGPVFRATVTWTRDPDQFTPEGWPSMANVPQPFVDAPSVMVSDVEAPTMVGLSQAVGEIERKALRGSLRISWGPHRIWKDGAWTLYEIGGQS